MTVENSMKKAANKGASLLDKHDPQWFEKIDLDTLDMNNCRNCVVGQLYGYYVESCEMLGFSLSDDYKYGFGLPPSVTSSWKEYKDPHYQIWRDIILERRLSSVEAIYSLPVLSTV